jgi:hypothetical protein
MREIDSLIATAGGWSLTSVVTPLPPMVLPLDGAANVLSASAIFLREWSIALTAEDRWVAPRRAVRRRRLRNAAVSSWRRGRR